MVSEATLSEQVTIHSIYATQTWIDNNPKTCAKYQQILTIINENELKKISSLATPNKVLAVVHLPVQQVTENIHDFEVAFYLDDLQDPGNAGTILRIAHWFGMSMIFVSNNTVDMYNSKVVQASMSAIFNLQIVQQDLDEIVRSNKNLHIIGAAMDGKPIQFYSKKKNPTLIVIGNEGRGLSADVVAHIKEYVAIPKGVNSNAESLNAAIAAGIFAYAFTN